MSAGRSAEVVAIPSGRVARGRITAPPSKSHAIRALVCAALSRATVPLRFARGPLPEDARAAAAALRSLGFGVEERSGAGSALEVVVTGAGGRIPRPAATLDAGGSATAARLLGAVCALGPGPYAIRGTPQLARRPAGAIVEALADLGVRAERTGEPEDAEFLTVRGGPARGGSVSVDASSSSHVVSALLLIAPVLPEGLDVTARGAVASEPYVELTVRTLGEFEVAVRAVNGRWTVAPGGIPGPHPRREGICVTGDWSSAAYLFGAAAATGGDVEVAGVERASPQPDRGALQVLASMGADASWTDWDARCAGRIARPVDADLRDAPDLAPLVGALACLVPGTSRVRGAAHLRIKETDRIAAVVRCAQALGCEARELPDGFEVTGPARHGADIDPEGDHRLAMAFAVAGLAVPGVRILDPGCVAKSYPQFWDDLGTLLGGPGLRS